MDKWWSILKVNKGQFFNDLVTAVNEHPDYEVVSSDAKRGHGGKIDFTEEEERERHEGAEPHNYFPPSSPGRVKGSNAFINVRLDGDLKDVVNRDIRGHAGRRRGQSFKL